MMTFKYSTEFYIYYAMTLIPSIIFLVMVIHRRFRPWVKDAIEDSDLKPHQTDLTFLFALVFGWIIANGVTYGVGLVIIEGQTELLGSVSAFFGFVTVLWGLNKFAAIKEYSMFNKSNENNA